MKINRFALAIVLVAMAACTPEETGPVAPRAEMIPHEMTLHGDTRIDNYYWLNQRDNPAVIAYLTAENEYTSAVMAHTEVLQETLFEEFKSRIPDVEESAPVKYGDYLYYTRQGRDQDYPLYYRRPAESGNAEELLLDANELASGHDYFSLANFSVSPDHKRIAFGIDIVGRRFYTLHILDVESGELMADTIPNVTDNFVWASDSNTIYYVRQNPQTLTYEKVYRHAIGSTDDELIYSEPDETFTVTVQKSLSQKFIYININSTVANEVYFLDAGDTKAQPLLIEPRERDHEYYVTDGGDRFYIRTNKDAFNFKLMEAPLDNPGMSGWVPVIQHRDDVLLMDVTAFADYLVLDERSNGLTRLNIIQRNSGEQFLVGFDEPAYAVKTAVNMEFDSNEMRYSYESFTRPSSVYEYSFKSRASVLVKQAEVSGDFDPANYQSERFFVTARDGAQVPVEIVYRKGMEKNGRNPVWQYGYGSYGSVYDPWFSSSRLSMLDRGFIFVLAHIRGGSEMGQSWYFDGRQLTKKNTFTDFIHGGRYLVEAGYTSPEHLYAEGGSAGGLLMGAVSNMAPELYNGINAGVAFVDVVTTMLDDSIPLTALEWDEWGNPADETFYEYILSYSPYDQVAARDYPNMLLTTGLHDSQVQYWEPAKWAAKLRELKTDDNILLLKTDMAAGHGGKSGRLQALRDVAFEYAFFLDLEGISQ
jgi:oligopeptidase B